MHIKPTNIFFTKLLPLSHPRVNAEHVHLNKEDIAFLSPLLHVSRLDKENVGIRNMKIIKPNQWGERKVKKMA